MSILRHVGKVCIVIIWTVIICGLLIFASGYRLFEPRKEITVFAWGEMFDEEILAEFERDTGITVNLSVYMTNEELLAKLRTLEGYGYDLVVPSDYVVNKLRNEDLLQPIDTSKLDFYQYINPVLLGYFFDPENRYSIPFEWEVYGIGINAYCRPYAQVYEQPWTCLFEPEKTFLASEPHAITMTNDPVEAIMFAAHYLYADVDWLTPEQQDAVADLLRHQRRWVEAYSNDRADYYLATNNACISVSQSSLMWRAMRHYDNIDFVLPKNDGFVTIEHCVIPKGTDKTDLVYQFLNYVYSRDSFKRHFAKFAFIPARYDVIDDLPATQQQKEIMLPSRERFAQYHFIHDIVPDAVKNRMWVSVKE